MGDVKAGVLLSIRPVVVVDIHSNELLHTLSGWGGRSQQIVLVRVLALFPAVAFITV